MTERTQSKISKGKRYTGESSEKISSKFPSSQGPPPSEVIRICLILQQLFGEKHVEHWLPRMLIRDSMPRDFFFFFLFVGPYLRHMEVPKPEVKSVLQLPAYTTATATQDPSLVYYLHHSLQQRQIPDPLSEARDQTCILMDISQVHYHWATIGTPQCQGFYWRLIA